MTSCSQKIAQGIAHHVRHNNEQQVQAVICGRQITHRKVQAFLDMPDIVIMHLNQFLLPGEQHLFHRSVFAGLSKNHHKCSLEHQCKLFSFTARFWGNLTNSCLERMVELSPRLHTLDLANPFKRYSLTDANVRCLASLIQLRKLSIRNQCLLTSIPLITSLQELNVSGCVMMVKLESIAALTQLRTLCLNDCKTLPPESINDLIRMTGLQRLFLDGCVNLVAGGRNLLPLTSLSNLQTLTLICTDLKDQEIGGDLFFPELKELDISGSPCLTGKFLKNFIRCAQLDTLRMRFCVKFDVHECVQSILSFSALKVLDLSKSNVGPKEKTYLRQYLESNLK